MKTPYASITFLTYENLDEGDHFYGEVLGLPLIEDQGWAKVYRIHGSAHVGLVAARGRPMTDSMGAGTLLSIVVEDVDDWYQQLKDETGIEILSPPAKVAGIPVYSFFLKDPGGYRVEIQAFPEAALQQRFGHISRQLLRPPCRGCQPADS
jgi:predicted enzyme related to lactoylglutathione lyase